MKISFDEIRDGDHFEDLVAAYFRELKNSDENNISNVEIKQSGVGTDGGRNIIIEFEKMARVEIIREVTANNIHNADLMF